MKSMRITLRQLEIFVAITRAGSTAAAAQQIALSQSAASMALNDLESQLGTPLFDRIGRRLVLNAHGERLYPQAFAVLEQVGTIETLAAAPCSTLRLAASTTIGAYVLPDMIARFRAHHPATRFEIAVLNTDEVVARVARLEVDAGLIEGSCAQRELDVAPWRSDELVLFAAASHPAARQALSAAALAGQEWVLREAGSGTRQMIDELLLPHVGVLQSTLELGSSEGIKRLVAQGVGVSILSRLVIADMLSDGQLTLLKSTLPPLRRTFLRIRHRQRSNAPLLEEFLNMAAQ